MRNRAERLEAYGRAVVAEQARQGARGAVIGCRRWALSKLGRGDAELLKPPKSLPSTVGRKAPWAGWSRYDFNWRRRLLRRCPAVNLDFSCQPPGLQVVPRPYKPFITWKPYE